MSPLVSQSPQETQARLDLRKGSRIAPIILLILSVILFVIYALPPGFDQLGKGVGLTSSASEPLTLAKVAKALETEEARNSLWLKVRSLSAWEFFQDIGRPMIKVYLDQLIDDFGRIAKSLVYTVLQLGLFALIPGLAGLIYRRNFTVWFLAGFAALVGINASGVFGSITGAEPMPGSGTIFFFLLSQLVLLMLAYRVQRHSKGLSFLPPRIQNWGLIAILVLIGIACWQGWGPGYRSGTTTAANGTATEFAAFAQTVDTGAAGTAGEAEVPAAPATAPAPAATPAPAVEASRVVTDDTGSSAARSWIWSFLGSGITGWIYRWEFILIGLPLFYTFLRNSAAWTAKAPKNIVLCLDGTSNTPDQLEMGFAAQTNVFKLFKFLKADKQGGLVPSSKFDASLSKRYGEKQIAFYYAGVGNKYDNDPIAQTLGLAMGMGAGDMVERAYLDLVRVYQPGDRVFIVGFSRGAAIARLLARTIDARGAPRSVWTLRLLGKHRTLWSSASKQPVPIDVLGCWDTVGSFGVAKTIAGINFQQLNMFKDLTIPDNVVQAYHMVALDEQRDSFEPTLMDPDPIRPERIVEVWFAGDHANIGGGWATDKLSDVTLDFLLSRVSSGYALDDGQEPGDEAWGLYLAARKGTKSDAVAPGATAGIPTVDPDPLGQVRHWFSNLYQYRPRKLPLHAVISELVIERMTKSMPVYAPQSLFDLSDALDAKRILIEAKASTLAKNQSLSADEHTSLLAFKDKLRLTRWPQYWQSVVAARAPKPASLVLKNVVPEPAGAALPKDTLVRQAASA